jgi:DNA-binding transcriptional ArsR family regulator
MAYDCVVRTPTSELLLHPVRLRIVLALGSEHLTTSGIAERLPDVPQATLYRQVSVLTEAGLFKVVAERRVRGSIERTYALVAEAVQIEADDVASMTTDEHMRGFITFVGSLVHSLTVYLDEPTSKPARDGLSYRQAAIWLSETERRHLMKQLGDVLAPYLAQIPAPERQRILLNTILIPGNERRR